MKLEPGSVDWFVEMRLQCIADAATFYHIATAHDFAARLQHDKDLDLQLKFSLFRSFIIEYSKPFSTTRGGKTYKIKNLRGDADFSIETHLDILELRNKLIAHQDAEFTDMMISVTSMKIGEEFKLVNYPMRVSVMGMFLSGIDDENQLSRFISHMLGSIRSLDAKCRESFEIFRHGAAMNPNEYEQFMSDARFKSHDDKSKIRGGEFQLGPPKHSEDLNAPEIRNKDGYIYSTITHSIDKTGKIRAKNKDGIVHQIEIKRTS